MTPDQANGKHLWSELQDDLRGDVTDFIVLSILAGQSNKQIWSNLAFDGETSKEYKAKCFAAFDYVRKENELVISL